MRVRSAAVAGLFYPDDPRQLDAAVRAHLASSPVPPGPTPKAIIAPHAGFVYSGPIAGSAYARWRGLGAAVTRVVLLGPAHRVAVRGLAAPTHDAWATPLGAVPLDRAALDRALEHPDVQAFDATHAREHSLEVHLPFLQVLFPRFEVVPLVVGDASPEAVAEVLALLWGGPETRVVISSDLSHFLPYEAAQALDTRTSEAIARLDGAALEPRDACGRGPIRGLLALARQRGLAVETLDVRNSGDTAGARAEVVGYGAWAFTETTP